MEAAARHIDKHPRAPYRDSVSSFSIKGMSSSFGIAASMKVLQEAVRGAVSGLGYDKIRHELEALKDSSLSVREACQRHSFIEEWLPTAITASALVGIDSISSVGLSNLLLAVENSKNKKIAPVINERFSGGVLEGVKSLSHGLKPAVLAQSYQWVGFLVCDRLLHQANEKETGRMIPTLPEQVGISAILAAVMSVATTPTSTLIGRMQADNARYHCELYQREALLKAHLSQLSSSAIVPYIRPAASWTEMLGKIANKGMASFFNPARIVHFAAVYFISSMLRQWTRGGVSEEAACYLPNQKNTPPAEPSFELPLWYAPKSYVRSGNSAQKTTCEIDVPPSSFNMNSLELITSNSEKTCPFTR
jgi:hypothetical protein